MRPAERAPEARGLKDAAFDTTDEELSTVTDDREREIVAREDDLKVAEGLGRNKPRDVKAAGSERGRERTESGRDLAWHVDGRYVRSNAPVKGATPPKAETSALESLVGPESAHQASALELLGTWIRAR